jgi:hypothetical protein
MADTDKAKYTSRKNEMFIKAEKPETIQRVATKGYGAHHQFIQYNVKQNKTLS